MREVQLASGPFWYVPDIDRNREDPDPFKVLIKPMTAQEHNTIEAEVMRKNSGMDSIAEVLGASGLDSIRETISRQVKEVRGYKLNGTVPTNGRELFDCIMGGPPREHSVLSMIYNAIKNSSELQPGVLKN